MAGRPKGELGDLVVPKDGEAPTRKPAVPGAKAYAHTLSLRLTVDQYRRLRRYVADQEEKTGARITHQAIIETALDEYLTREGA